MEKDPCLCGGGEMVLACSGGSNVGQITNEVAKLLDSGNDAVFSCLAGVGGGISGFKESAKGAEMVLVIDGCQLCCGKACMENAGLTGYEHIVVTDFDVEKTHEITVCPDEIERVISAAKQKLGVKQNG